MEPRVGPNDPCGSFPTLDILHFHESACVSKAPNLHQLPLLLRKLRGSSDNWVKRVSTFIMLSMCSASPMPIIKSVSGICFLSRMSLKLVNYYKFGGRSLLKLTDNHLF